MHTYLETIKQAAVLFPVIAIVFTIPYLIYNYKKYGSIMSLRLWIIYSFVLYLLITYCLVILPLPSTEKARTLTGHHLQLNPFGFVFDIIKNTKIDPSNIFMTLPFGFYLRYYFQNSLRQVLVKTFLLSLFFELTQLSGLYFIYAGNYRLFDVDDLITNTLGGFFGYLLANLLANFLPTRTDIDQKSFDRSKKISLLRRIVAMAFDIIASIIFMLFIGTPFMRILGFDNIIPISLFTIILLLTVVSPITKGRTLGFFMTNLKVKIDGVTEQPQLFKRILHYFIRYSVFILQFILAPYLLFHFIQYLVYQETITGDAIAIISISFIFAYLLYLFISSIIVAIKKPLLYESLSKTSLENTTINKSQKT